MGPAQTNALRVDESQEKLPKSILEKDTTTRIKLKITEN